MRYGTAAGSVVVGARRVPIRRPRVRGVDDGGEVRLHLHVAARSERFLVQAAMEALVSGTSQAVTVEWSR